MARYRNWGWLLLTLVALPLAAAARAQREVAAEAPSWERLRDAYRYEARPQQPKVAEREAGEHLLQHVTFTSPDGEAVPGLFLRPQARGGAGKRYPCVLLLHGLTSSKEMMSGLFGRALADQGIASLALDIGMHGERRKPGEMPRGGPALATAMRSGIVEYRQALDWLAARPDVDPRRIGLIGYSLGSMMGSILAAVEPRIGAVVLCVGGDMFRGLGKDLPPAGREAIAYISPSLYIGRVSPRPILMINGKADNVVPEAAAKLLFDAARQPKEIVWVEGGHLLKVEDGKRGVQWMAVRLRATGTATTGD